MLCTFLCYGKHKCVLINLYSAQDSVFDEAFLQAVDIALIAYTELVEEALCVFVLKLACSYQLVVQIVCSVVRQLCSLLEPLLAHYRHVYDDKQGHERLVRADV